jgi:hypothetical protein
MRLGSVVMLLVAGTNAGKRGATVTGSITSDRTRECPIQLCEIRVEVVYRGCTHIRMTPTTSTLHTPIH